MIHSITRRDLTARLSAYLSLGSGGARAAEINADLAAIERRAGGRLGVFAIETGSGRTLAHRADERFTLCSTFKGILAAYVLSRVDSGKESLTRLIRYSEKDLIFTSPVTQAHVREGALSVAKLCEAIVEVSDNTAAILLLKSVGGPPALTRFIRSLGDNVTRSDRYEPDSNNYSGVLDTTSPRAIVGTAHTILLGNTLSGASRHLLESWMIASKPGLTRLRASMPPTWIVADKTGTSTAEETNDYALVRPPGRAPLLVAAYYDAPKRDLASREAVLREVGKVFAKWVE